MRAEILDQPAALARCLASLRRQAEAAGLRRPWDGAVLTGSGDSYLAPLALQYAARLHAGTPVAVLPAMEAAHYLPFSRDALVMAISVSGEARRTIAAARAARAAGAFVVAVSARPESTLARTAARCLVLEAPSRSRRTPHTTDFLTTLLAVAVVVEALAGGRLEPLDELPSLVGDLVAQLEEPCHALARDLAACTRFTFLGAGPSFAVAHYGAAKLWEAGGIEAHAFELEEFAHGPHFLVEAGDPVVLVAPPGRSAARAREIADGLGEVSARAVALPVTELPEAWSPFATTVPVQWLAWALATEKGYDVVRKDGRHADPAPYERAHERWVRS
jgi:glucosamine--fructose-6-phosphate aminotransferase (isomerizing)